MPRPARLLLGVVNVIDASIMGALLTRLKQEFALSDEQLARLASAFTVAGMVGAPLFGYFASRFGRKASVAVGVLVWSIGSIASGFAGGLVSLLVWARRHRLRRGGPQRPGAQLAG